MIASVVDSFFVPVTRMVTHTGIVATRQALPKIALRPEDPEDYGKVDIIADANDHVDLQCSMEEVMDQVLIDLSVIGNAVIEDFVEYRYRSKRSKKLDKNGKWTGKWTTTYYRDMSKPKIGSRARSPWECAFGFQNRTNSEISRCTFQDVLSLEEFQEIYHHGNADVYINTEHVKGGIVWLFKDNEWKHEDKRNNMVVVQHYQDEPTDVYRIYANGILIQDESLTDFHAHGKITLSLLTKHHKYDSSLKHHGIYGIGDPELMAELDDMVQAITNQFIKNYELKNTYVVGLENASTGLEDIDILSGDVIPGRINIQSLGVSDLPEFLEFKNHLEEWIIQLTKKNYKRLEGEVAKTAYEARQKKAAENMGMIYEIKRLENVGLKAHYQKRISDIMEYMTEEELIDISEEQAEVIMSYTKKLEKHQYVLNKNGKPIQIKYRERFRTPGRVYEVEIDGKPHVDGIRQNFELDGNDGVLTAHPEYLWTREWIMHKRVPDFYVVGATILGQDNMEEYAKLIETKNLAAEAMQYDPSIKVDWQNIIEKGAELNDMRREQIIKDASETEAVAKDREIVQSISDVLQQKQATPVDQASLGGNLGAMPQGAPAVQPQSMGGTVGGNATTFGNMAG